MNFSYGTISIKCHNGCKPTDEEAGKARKVTDDVCFIRGKLLHELVAIEIKLEDVILLYFCENSETKRLLFTEHVLRRRSNTTNDKYEIVSEVSRVTIFENEEHELKREEGKTFRRLLKELIRLRNILAHNRVTVRIPEYNAYVEYIENHKNQKLFIDDKLCQEISIKIESVDQTLNKIKEIYAQPGSPYNS